MNDENYLAEWKAIRNPAVAKGAVRMLHTLAGFEVPAETWPLLYDVLDKYNVPLDEAAYALNYEFGSPHVCAYFRALDLPEVHFGECRTCKGEVPIHDGDCLVCGTAVVDLSGTPRA